MRSVRHAHAVPLRRAQPVAALTPRHVCPSSCRAHIHRRLAPPNSAAAAPSMEELAPLFQSNRRWASNIFENNPDYFRFLSSFHAPEYLWIGCSDARVPANEIVGLSPGELFVHRNIANMVVHTDLNCLSVVQYAVDVLKVKHIMVVGHFGCGGVRAALEKKKVGLVTNWLRHIQDVQFKHQDLLNSVVNLDARVDKLVELNVIEQVANLVNTTVLQDAWDRGQKLNVHACVYGLNDGLLRDLNFHVTPHSDFPSMYKRALDLLRPSKEKDKQHTFML